MPPHAEGGPVALVTGGARRVGRATCLALARAGCRVHFTFRTSDEDARSLEREIGAQGHQLDLSDLPAVERFAARMTSELPRLDIVVHNASVYAPSPLESVSAAEMLANYRVNAVAPLLLTRSVLPLLRASEIPGGASVVCLCDIHALGRPRKGFYAYAMAKAALAEMVRGLALELAPDVRVNGVAPGVVAFPEDGYESDPAMQERYLKRVPLGRSGTPEDAAGAVKWLAMDATYITGEIVRVDGGRWVT